MEISDLEFSLFSNLATISFNIFLFFSTLLYGIFENKVLMLGMAEYAKKASKFSFDIFCFAVLRVYIAENCG
jgi:hypothetical protein